MKLVGYSVLLIIALLSSCSDEPSASEDAISVVQVIQAPGNDISGLAWGDGSLWAVDSETATVFRIDPSGGEVLNSFACDVPPMFETTGLAYSEQHSMVLVGMWDRRNNGYVFQYSQAGELQASTSMCGG